MGKSECGWVPAATAATATLYFFCDLAFCSFVHLLFGILFLRNPMDAIVLGGEQSATIWFDFAFRLSLQHGNVKLLDSWEID